MRESHLLMKSLMPCGRLKQSFFHDEIHDKLQAPLKYSCGAEKKFEFIFLVRKWNITQKDQLKVLGINDPCFIF